MSRAVNALEESEDASFDATLSFLDEFVEEVDAADTLPDTPSDIIVDGDIHTVIPSDFHSDDLAHIFQPDAEQHYHNEGQLFVNQQSSLLHHDSQESITHQPHQHLTLKKKKKVKKYSQTNPNKVRDERRQELVYLRSKVHNMEQQLKRLKEAPRDSNHSRIALLELRSLESHTAHQTECAGLQLDSMCPPSALTSASSVWEDIARRQYDQRMDVERENVRLKLVLETQLKVAKSLQNILNKRTTSRAIEMFGIGHHSKRVHDSSPSQSDRAIYEELAAGVDKCYANIDAIFEANGLAHTESPHSGAEIKEGGANGIYLEIFANKIMPFEMHTTGAAVWQHFAHDMDRLPCSFYRRKDSKSPESTDDIVYESFRLESHANKTSADLSIKQVLRRYVEEERVIVVWASIVDPVKFASEPASGYRFYEEGYVVTRKPKSLSSDFTLVQTCFILTPDFCDRNRNQMSRTGALTNFVLNSITKTLSVSHQVIENVLLEQALKARTIE